MTSPSQYHFINAAGCAPAPDPMSGLSDGVSAEPQRCTARNREGKRCGRFALKGTNVCNFHGANAPAVRRSAERAVVTSKALAIVSASPLPPIEELNVPGEIRAALQRLSRFCAVIEQEATRLDEFTTEDKLGKVTLAPVVDVYRQTLRDLTDLLIKAKRAGLADDEEAVEREKWERIAAAVNRGVASHTAGLDFDQIQRVRRGIAQELGKVYEADEDEFSDPETGELV